MTAQTILPANSVTGGFEVSNSLRFDKPSDSYLAKTFSSAGSTRKFTFSTWLKGHDTGVHGSTYFFVGNINGSSNIDAIGITNTGIQISINSANSGSLNSAALFRDYSAWYHFVIGVDTEQGTASNRVKVYINGVQITDWDTETYPSQNYDFTGINSTEVHNVSYSDSEHNGYLCETVFIDGTQLDPTSFGEFDGDSGIWKPKKISGLTFGQNGFYLQYKQTGTSANSSGLGADTSGNDHHFSVNGLAAHDQSTDTCTNNFCTLNPLTARGSSGNTLAEGNLQYSAVAGAGDSSVFGTLAIPPGMKVYFEVKLVQNTAQNSIGIHDLYDGGDGAYVSGGSEAGTYSFKPRGAASVTQYFNNGSSTNHSVNNAANDTILGVAIDNENGQIHYSLDGTFINNSDPTDNNPVALVTGFGGATEQYIHASLDTSGGTEPINQFNFGSPPYVESGGNSDANGHGNFNQAVPSGYFALNTKNLAEHG